MRSTASPGIEGAHEKGGVEGQVGYFRRNHLVPVPEVDSLAELNARIAVAEQAEDARRIGARIRTIGQDFAAEAPRLLPLPDEAFETGLLLSPRVDRYSQVTVRMNRYSVPVRLIGRQVRVVLRRGWPSSPRQHSQNGCEAMPVMSGSKSIAITWSRSSHDSKPTWSPVVDHHHEPGKCEAPFAQENDRTGRASSSRAVTQAASGSRCLVPSASVNSRKNRRSAPEQSSCAATVMAPACRQRIRPGPTIMRHGP
jgi:hypothetical protein